MMSKYAEWWKQVLTGSIPKEKKDKDDDTLIWKRDSIVTSESIIN